MQNENERKKMQNKKHCPLDISSSSIMSIQTSNSRFHRTNERLLLLLFTGHVQLRFMICHIMRS